MESAATLLCYTNDQTIDIEDIPSHSINGIFIKILVELTQYWNVHTNLYNLKFQIIRSYLSKQIKLLWEVGIHAYTYKLSV